MHLTPLSVTDFGCLVFRAEEGRLHSCKQLTDKFEIHCAKLTISESSLLVEQAQKDGACE